MKKTIVPIGIILLFVFGIFMYVNRFTIFHINDVEGYVFNTDDIATNLTGGVTKDSPKITYEKIKVNDNIYKSGKKYYVGEENKKSVVLDYPIVADDSSSLLILSDTGMYIDTNFEKSTTYKNSIITERELFNGVNKQKVGDEKYNFIELGNGIFVNLVEIKIKNNDNNYSIPKYSFIFFERSFLRYYYDSNGVYRYKEIVAIQDFAETSVGNKKYDYYDLLLKLGVLSKTEEKYEEKEEEDENESGTPEKEDHISGSTTDADSIQLPPPNDTSGGANYVDKEYVKPEAKASNVSSGVYSFKGHLDVYDPADRIYKPPTFEFKIDGELYLRMTYSRTSDFIVSGLLPDTEYTVKCVYNYKDERDQKREGTCLKEMTFRTKDTSNLERLQLHMDKITPDINDVTLNGLRFKNKEGSEVLYGLKTVTIEFSNGISTNMTFGNVSNLKTLKVFDYKTNKILNSGTKYDAKIRFYDVAGNELAATGNFISFETLKSPPKAELEVKTDGGDFTEANLSVVIQNKDKVTAKNYKYIIFDENGKEITRGDLKSPEESTSAQKKLITRLDPETNYVAIVYCDYVNNNNEWVNNYELATANFYTADFSSLGTVPVALKTNIITATTADITLQFPKYDAELPVYKLMNSIVPIKIVNTTNPDEVYEFNAKKADMRYGYNIKLPGSNGELSSNSKFIITVSPYILTGTVGNETKYDLVTNPEQLSFKTIKKDAYVHVANGFIANGYIDFDICIEDPDEAIADEEVELTIKNNGQTAHITYIEPKYSCTVTPPKDEEEDQTYTGYEYFDRVTATSLDSTKIYDIGLKYSSYNVDSSKTPQTNMLVDIASAVKVDGTSAKLKLVGMTNKVNYQVVKTETDESVDLERVNLFDITNQTRWRYMGANSTENTQETKLDDKEIVFTTSNGGKLFSYYMPELKGKAYTISFEYTYVKGGGDAYLVLPSDSVLQSTTYTESNITSSKNYSIATASTPTHKEDGQTVYDYQSKVIKVCKNGETYTGCHAQPGKYISFFIKQASGKESKLSIKNIKIELDHNNYPQYSTFGEENPQVEHTNLFAGEFDVSFNNTLTKELGLTYPMKFYNSEWTYRYYVDFKIDGKSVLDEGSELNDLSEYITENAAENISLIKKQIIEENLPADRNITAEIGVEVIYGVNVHKKHVLEVLDFSTEAETRTISSKSDFLSMHPYGYYLVDLTEMPASDKCEGAAANEKCINLTAAQYPLTFQGSIDFQGQKVQLNIKDNSKSANGNNEDGTDAIFVKIGGGGVVKNIDLEINFSHKNQKPDASGKYHTYERLYYFYALATTNNGVVSNIKVTSNGKLEPKAKANTYTEEFVVGTKLDEETNEEIEIKERRTTRITYKDVGHSSFSLLVSENSGIIENFVIKLNDEIQVGQNAGLVAITNKGIIKNGYVYGKNIDAGLPNSAAKNIGVIAGKSANNSKITNVYSLIDITTIQKTHEATEVYQSTTNCYKSATEYEACVMAAESAVDDTMKVERNTNSTQVGGLVYNATKANITNAFSVDPRYIDYGGVLNGFNYNYETSNRSTDKDPLIISSSSSTIDDIYYIGKENIGTSSNVSKKVIINTLSNSSFMKQTLNSDNMFNVDQSSMKGEFPTLLWPSTMPEQEKIKIPKADTSNQKKFEIVSIAEVNQDRTKFDGDDLIYKDNYYAKIILQVYNPDKTNLKIENFIIESINDTEDISDGLIIGLMTQGANDNIQSFHIYIKEPKAYRTKYKLKDIVVDVNGTKMSCSIDEANHTTTFSQFFACGSDPILELDLYKEVGDFEEISIELAKSSSDPTKSDNFRLKNNINAVDYTFNEFNAVLDGNGNTIKNMNVTNCFIKNLKGTIKNLNITNLNVAPSNDATYSKYAALVCSANTNSLVDNVHVGSNVCEDGSDTCDTKPGAQLTATVPAETDTVYIGGLVGYSNGGIITNSSVSNMSLYDQDTLTSNTINLKTGRLHIGGLLGYGVDAKIYNSFVRGINLEIYNYQPGSTKTIWGFNTLLSAGGIVGGLPSGVVENVYATGTINGKAGSGNLGGIAGNLQNADDENLNGILKSVISRVNVYNNADNVGGIAGLTREGTSSISKSLTMGNILTTIASTKNFDRTTGVSIQSNRNFAWDRQSKNSSVTANSKFEELLSDSELKNPTIYETKIGLSPTAFTVGTNDYERVVVIADEDDPKKTKAMFIAVNEIKEEITVEGVVRKYYEKKSTKETNNSEENDEEDNRVYIQEDYGSVPKLYHSTKKDINGNPIPLRNQEYGSDLRIQYIESFEIIGNPEIKYSDDEGNTVRDFEATKVRISLILKIADPEIDYDSLMFEISDMQIVENPELYNENRALVQPAAENYPDNYYRVTMYAKADMNKYYDSYMIEKITFKKKNILQEPYRTKLKMVIPFYGRIDDIEKWQQITPGTLQNIVIVGDIDFTGISSADANINLTFNKLIGLPGKYDADPEAPERLPMIKNLTYESATANKGLIKNAVSELRGLSFYNINMKCTAPSTNRGNYFGIIHTTTGDMLGRLDTDTTEYTMHFEKIKIEAPNVYYVGMVANNNANKITNISLNDIQVQGYERVGGFIGSTAAKQKENITATNIRVKGGRYYTGGLIGYEPDSVNVIRNKNFTVTGIYVYGGHQTGGVFGHGSGSNITITGTTETADVFGTNKVLNQVYSTCYYVGGVSGYVTSNNLVNNTSEGLSISACHYVGGLFGYGRGNNNSKSIKNTIEARRKSSVSKAGGISGATGAYSTYGAQVLGCTIKGHEGSYEVGGIQGTINGWSYLVGNIVGPYVEYNEDGEITELIETKITGGYNVGGIVGVQPRQARVQKNIVSAIITASHSVGGLIGYINNGNSQTWNQEQPINYNIVANSTITATTGVKINEFQGEVAADGKANTKEKTYYFVGGIAGRISKHLSTHANNNVVSATIEAGQTKDSLGLNGMGYLIGGSSYYFIQTSTVPSEIEGEPATKVYTPFDYTTQNADYYIYGKFNGVLSSNMKETRLYTNSTLNGVSYADMINSVGTSHEEYYNTHYKETVKDHLTQATDYSKLSSYNVVASPKVFKECTFNGESENPEALKHFPCLTEYTNHSLIPLNYNVPNSEEDEASQSASSNRVSSTSNYHVLPDFEVYAVDVDKINIEFKDIDLKTYFIINDQTYKVDQNVFTFYYDFKEDFKIKLSDGKTIKEITISADEVRNGVSVMGEYYFYIDENGEVVTNKPEKEIIENDYAVTEENKVEEEYYVEEDDASREDAPSSEDVIEEETTNDLVLPLSIYNRRISFDKNDAVAENKLIEDATNIYGQEVLLDNKNVYNIITGEVVENDFDNLTLVTNSKPMYSFEYGANDIETYYYYSIINGKRINKQVYLKNGQIEIVEQGLDNNKSVISFSNYNDENYLIYLGNDGKIYSLKDDIKYPSDFKNFNIKSLSTNVSTDSDLLFVEYEDGKHEIFNYRTGQSLKKRDESDIGLLDYVKDYLKITSDNVKKITNNDSYEEAKKLVSVLNEKSIDQVLKGDSVVDTPELYSKKYSIVYNPSTKMYEVYEIPTEDSYKENGLLESVSTSVNTIIENNPVLYEYYKKATSNKVNRTSAIILTIVIIIAIMISVFLVGRYYKKVRKQRS